MYYLDIGTKFSYLYKPSKYYNIEHVARPYSKRHSIEIS